MGGGDSGSSTTTVNPWSEASPYLEEVLRGGQDIFRQQAGQDYTKDYIGMTPEQLSSINSMMNYYGSGGQYDSLVGNATNAWQSMLQDPSVTANSAEVQNMISAATNPMIEQLTTSVLPSVRSGAAGAGQYGSTRQGVAEGIATGQTQDAIGNTTANIIGDIYSQSLGAQQTALAMSDAMTNLGTGGQQQIYDLQNLIRSAEQEQADVDYWNKTSADMVPYQNWLDMLLPMSGLGSSSTTTSSAGEASTAQQIGGAAMTGLGTYGALAGAGVASATPIGWAAGLAALLGSQ